MGWPPSNEQELSRAAAGGLLEERQKVELKREIAAGPGPNEELAKDLASLAVDGGLFVVGVDEKAGFGLTPVDLTGLPERIEQVARSRIDEPLYVTFVSFPAAESGKGYLIVQVPPSPRAPHMVSHRYWGRGDKTKYPLSDAEVERLMALRTRWAEDAELQLNRWVARDPVPVDARQTAHLYLVAAPVPLREGAMLRLLGGTEWTERFRDLVTRTRRPGSAFWPDYPENLSNFHRRPDGWAFSNWALTPDRRLEERANDDRLMELEITEEGIVRLLAGRATARSESGKRWIIDSMILGLTYRTVTLAASISSQARLVGSWDIGVAVMGLTGAFSYLYSQAVLGGGTPYIEESYRATTRASAEEMGAAPGRVVERLLGRFARGLGIYDLPQISPYFQA